ncbi:MAG: plasmid pRiA4b ORF-3 family protein [Bacteroidota bacterium]
MSSIYQLKVTLLGIKKPPIWRRILVKSDQLLSYLHKIIQTSMGWTNSHLHQFVKGRQYFSPPDPDGWMDTVDYSKMTIARLLQKKGDKMVYEYDFGDGWEHVVLLEAILQPEAGKTYPHCIKGKNACPPEDCGGIWGYQELKEIMANPKHEQYKRMSNWLGKKTWDATKFDLDKVNQKLAKKDFGVRSWF